MKIGDILAIDDPVGLAHGLFRRLIPLAQGERFDELPGAAQGFFCVFEWRAEVGNGGHHQYFTNSSGDRAARTRAALGQMGPADAASLFARALAAFPGAAPPADRDERVDWLLAHDEAAAALRALDEPLAALEPRIFAALAAHVRAHASAFAVIDRYPSGLKALPLAGDAGLRHALAVAPSARCSAAMDALSARVSADALAALSPAQRRFFLAYAVVANMLDGGLEALRGERPGDAEPSEALDAAAQALGGALGDEVRRVARWVAAPGGAGEDAEAALAALGGDVPGILAALAAFADRHADELPPPPPDPFFVITATAFGLGGGVSAKRDGARGVFLDAFDVLDEVSCGGFEGYLFCGAADRSASALAALRTLGQEPVAALLERALATLGGSVPTDAPARRARLAALADDARETLREAGRAFQSERTALARALADHAIAHASDLDEP